MRVSLRTRPAVLIVQIVCLIVILIAIFSGHPPSEAQDIQTWQSIHESSADVRQDTQIGDIQGKIAANSALLTATSSTMQNQGEELARLDTKMTDLFAFLGFLQVVGIGISFTPLKRRNG